MICSASTRCLPRRRSSSAAALAAKSAYGKKVCIAIDRAAANRMIHPPGGGGLQGQGYASLPRVTVGGAAVAAPHVGQLDLVAGLVRPDGRDQRVRAVDRAGRRPWSRRRRPAAPALAAPPPGRDARCRRRPGSVPSAMASATLTPSWACAALPDFDELLGDRCGPGRSGWRSRGRSSRTGRRCRAEAGDRAVDADHLAGHVDQRAAGVAGVDGRVGLDRVDDGAGSSPAASALAGADRAVERADDAAGDGALQAERRADRHDALAGARSAESAEGGRRAGPETPFARITARSVTGSRPDDRRRRGRPVVEGHRQGCRPLGRRRRRGCW